MSKYWQTVNGEIIAYEDLTDSHLLNILRYIERTTEEGLKQVYAGVYDYDGDVDYIYGDEVKDVMDYEGLTQEAKNRGLIK